MSRLKRQPSFLKNQVLVENFIFDVLGKDGGLNGMWNVCQLGGCTAEF